MRDGVPPRAAPAIPIEVVAGSVRPPARQRPDPFGTDPFGDPFEERRLDVSPQPPPD